ncbi:MAG: TOBE domain-containing protein, partial [Bacillota bacterium]|nr:TOBE domain-containing protein [Bacillota bacterium]
VHDEEVYLATLADSKVDVDVDITEAMGAETQLYIVLEGNNFIAKVNPRSTAKAGDKITVALDLDKMHLFDKETTLTII